MGPTVYTHRSVASHPRILTRVTLLIEIAARSDFFEGVRRVGRGKDEIVQGGAV